VTHAFRPSAFTSLRPVILLAALATALASPSCAQERPSSDSSFAGLVARLSETGGYFDSDNIISNESSYLQVASQFAKAGTHGGVYIGVGPDQNFSYIALVRPSIAFMLDIRRDNMLEHLLFKSIFAQSRNRVEYLCRLFGKPIPADVESWNSRSVGLIIAYLQQTPTDSASVQAYRRASNDRILLADNRWLDRRFNLAAASGALATTCYMDRRILRSAKNQGCAASDIANQAATAGDVLGGGTKPPGLRNGNCQTQTK